MKSKILLVLLLGLSLVFARSEIPYVFEEEDFGNEGLPKFLYALSVDCDTGQIRQEVFNEQVEPLEGVSSYLRYHDYASPLISSGTSNADGVILHQVPGDIDLYTGLFILVIEEPGYQNKEIHFDINPCFVEEPEPVPEPEPYVPPEEPVTEPEEPPEETPVTPSAEEPAPENESAPEEIQENQTEPDPVAEEAGPEGCAIPAVLVLLCGLFAFRRE